MIQKFFFNDIGYEDWCRNHPNAYVFNFFKGAELSISMNKMHHVSCRHLALVKELGKQVTSIEKVCSEDLSELVEFADVEQGKGRWSFCKSCFKD